MKFVKGIYQDSDPIDIPEGFLKDARNTVITNTPGAIENEPGHLEKLLDTSTKQYLGILPLDDKSTLVFYVDDYSGPATVYETVLCYSTVDEEDATCNCTGIPQDPILLSVPSGTSGIQIVNDAGVVTKIIDDAMISDGVLGFDINNPIEATFYIDYKGDRIVAFIENNNVPRLINIDKDYSNTVNFLSDFNLFAEASFGELTVVNPVTGGSLVAGSYAFTYRYVDDDQSTTEWAPITRAVPVTSGDITEGGSAPGLSTDKSITVTLDTPDLNYNKIQFGIIKSIQGVITAHTVSPTEVSAGSISYTYTGNALEESQLLENFTTPTAKYTRAKTITQLNNRLYLGNVVESGNISYQKYALDIEIDWKCEMVNITTNQDTIVNETTFMPGEVYAFYIQFQLIDGTFSRAFHIPGRTPQAGDLAEITKVNSRGTVAPNKYLKFSIEDTCDGEWGTLDGVGRGNLGIWQNQNEKYSNDVVYNSTDVATPGRDLRGQKVLHHKFPTLKYFRENEVSNGNNISPADIGRTYMPKLSIEVSNVVIPDSLAGQVIGYRILHAKVEISSLLNVGQSIVVFNGVEEGTTSFRYYPSCGAMDVNNHSSNPNGEIRGYSQGNVDNAVWDSSKGPSRFIRFHSIDMLVDKPALSPDLLRLELLLDHGGTATRTELPNVLNAQNSQSSYRYNFFDYTADGNSNLSEEVNNSGNYLMPVEFVGYIPTGGIINKDDAVYNNVAGEEHALLENLDLDNFNITSLTVSRPGTFSSNYIGSAPVGDPSSTTNRSAHYRTHIGSLLQIKTDLYMNFQNRVLDPCDNSYVNPELEPIPRGIITKQEFKGGNAFICRNTVDLTAPLDTILSLSFDGATSETGAINGEGCKVTIHYPGYNYKNANLRYSDISNAQSYFYPQSEIKPVLDNATTTAKIAQKVYLGKQVLNTKHEILYSTDYSLKIPEETTPALPFNPAVAIETNFPNTIARSLVQDPRQNSLNWKLFLVADTYTIERKNGPITNLASLGNQRLLIHTEQSLYITKDRTTLKGDLASVTLGAGDIFEIAPTEVLTADQGYAGCQHKFAAVVTKLGYVFPDVRQGKLFAFAGDQLQEISANGLRKFFRDNLNPSLIDNPFQRKGITIHFDENLNRLLVTQIDADNRNKEFTLSYSPSTNSFVSYHDYLPYLYIKLESNELNMFIHSDDVTKQPKLYVMTKDDYTRNFLDQNTRPVMSIEAVWNMSKFNAKLFQSLEWVTDAVTKTTTFQTLRVTSPTRDSGLINLIQRQGISQVHTQNLRLVENKWRFNNLRNILSSGYANQLPWYKKSRFIDNYVVTQFTYVPINEERLRVLDIEIKARPSFR